MNRGRNGVARSGLLLGAILLAVMVLFVRLWAQRQAVEQLTVRLQHRGVRLEHGAVQHHLFATTVRDVKIAFTGAPGISVNVDAIDVKAQLLSFPTIDCERIVFSLNGEPTALHADLNALPDWRDFGLSPKRLDVEYAHRIFGLLSFESVSFEHRGPVLELSADRVRLGTMQWANVRGSMAPRNEILELGVGTGPIQSAPFRIAYYPSSRGGSQWTVDVQHQSVRHLARQAGWELGPEFESAFVVGTLSFIVPDDPTLSVMGSVQLVMDNFPKPAWSQAERLLGSTIGFTSRIEPASDGSRWDFPQVDVTMAPFSMAGVGRIEWGAQSRLAVDVSGSLNCAKLAANLPPSDYLESVKRHLANRAPLAAKLTTELVPLHLQLAATSKEQGSRHVAWQLNPGCGISELTAGTFQTLGLPQHVIKRRGSR